MAVPRCSRRGPLPQCCAAWPAAAAAATRAAGTPAQVQPPPMASCSSGWWVRFTTSAAAPRGCWPCAKTAALQPWHACWIPSTRAWQRRRRAQFRTCHWRHWPDKASGSSLGRWRRWRHYSSDQTHRQAGAQVAVLLRWRYRCCRRLACPAGPVCCIDIHVHAALVCAGGSVRSRRPCQPCGHGSRGQHARGRQRCTSW